MRPIIAHGTDLDAPKVYGILTPVKTCLAGSICCTIPGQILTYLTCIHVPRYYRVYIQMKKR